jgi:hypothetical protein
MEPISLRIHLFVERITVFGRVWICNLLDQNFLLLLLNGHSQSPTHTYSYKKGR